MVSGGCVRDSISDGYFALVMNLKPANGSVPSCREQWGELNALEINTFKSSKVHFRLGNFAKH